MNRSPINAIAINGDTYVRMSAEALIEVNGDLPLIYGNSIRGSADVQVRSCLPWGALIYPTAEAVVGTDAFLTSHVAKGSEIESTADIEVDTEYRTKIIWHPKFDATVEIQATNAGKPVTGNELEGNAQIVFDGDLESEIRPAPWGSGTAIIRLESRLNPRVSRSQRPIMGAEIHALAHGSANLRMYSPYGEADINVNASGVLRLGGKQRLSGRASIVIEARGKSDKWHQIYAGGTAEIKVLFDAHGVGRPPIPDHYVPAHPRLQFYVGRENRRFIVPKDRRRLR